MYEKTIANDHLIFEVNLTSTPTLAINLLSPTDLEEYQNKLNTSVLGYPNGYKRIVIDGYIVGTTTVEVSHKFDGVFDSIAANIQYTFPISDWLNKSYIKGSGPAIIRIFFS